MSTQTLTSNINILSNFSINNIINYSLNIKPDHEEPLIDDSILIWFHDENLSFDIQRAMQIQLYQKFKYVEIFTEKEVFTNHLSDEFIVPILQFIISGEHAQELCNLIPKKPEKYYIYELDLKLNQTTRRSSNTWFTFSNINELFKILFNDLERRRPVTIDKNEEILNENEHIHKTFLPLPLGIFNLQSIPTSLHFFDKQSSTFLLFQLLNKIIIQMDDESRELKIMCVFCRKKYVDDAAQIEKINLFEKDYSKNDAIEYYTKYFFLCQSLTEVFSRENTDGIYTFRQYISDLHKQLQQKHKPFDDEIILYRGKKITLLVLQQLKNLNKQIDKTNKFISMNGFLSTTKNQSVAECFAGIGGKRNGYESAIFKLRISRSMTSKIPYVDITRDSHYTDEEEILFSMGSIWKLVKIENNNDVWWIELELSNKFDEQLNEFNNKLLNDYSFLDKSSNDYYKFLLAKVLYELGRYLQAKKFYNSLLKKDLSPQFQSLIYLNLATLQNEQGDYSEALETLKKTLNSPKLETIPLQSIRTMPSQITIFNFMGLLYQKHDEYENARHSFEQALKEQGDTIEKAIAYNNLGVLEMLLGKHTETAYIHLEEAVKLSENSVYSHKFKKDLKNLEDQLKKNKSK